METKDLKNVPLMESTEANGIRFDDDALHNVAHAFDALDLAGRIPLKVGHEGPDARDNPASQFALGWVSRVWVEGSKLMADFTGIPAKAYDWIKTGLLKYVSVELLKDVKAGNRRLPWVLDAVALLGSDQPAFGNLGDLQSLTMKRGPQLQSEGRVSFSRGTGESEADKLRAQNARLQAQLIHGQFEAAIQSGRILPRDRESFRKRYGETGSVDDATAWIASSPTPVGFSSTLTTVNQQQQRPTFARADEEMVHRTYERIEFERKERGREISYLDASRLVMSEDRELARRWIDMPGELARR